MDVEDTKSYHNLPLSTIKAECLSKGISNRGTRYSLICRLLRHHLAQLEAEYANERSMLSGSGTDEFKAEKLFYRIEVYKTHVEKEKVLACEMGEEDTEYALANGKYTDKEVRIWKWLLDQVDHKEQVARERS